MMARSILLEALKVLKADPAASSFDFVSSSSVAALALDLARSDEVIDERPISRLLPMRTSRLTSQGHSAELSCVASFGGQAKPAVRYNQAVHNLAWHLVARNEDRQVVSHRHQPTVEHPVQRAGQCQPVAHGVTPLPLNRANMRRVHFWSPAPIAQAAALTSRSGSHRLRALCGETPRRGKDG